MYFLRMVILLLDTFLFLHRVCKALIINHSCIDCITYPQTLLQVCLLSTSFLLFYMFYYLYYALLSYARYSLLKSITTHVTLITQILLLTILFVLDNVVRQATMLLNSLCRCYCCAVIPN